MNAEPFDGTCWPNSAACNIYGQNLWGQLFLLKDIYFGLQFFKFELVVLNLQLIVLDFLIESLLDLSKLGLRFG